MGKIDLEGINALRNTIRTNIGFVIKEYINKSTSIDRKMESVIRSYSEYSDVTSKAREIQRKVSEIKSQATKLEDSKNRLVEGLKNVVSSVKEEERESKQIIKEDSKRLKVEKVTAKSGSAKNGRVSTLNIAEIFRREIFDNQGTASEIDSKSIAEKIKEYGQEGIVAFDSFLDELADDKNGSYIKFLSVDAKNEITDEDIFKRNDGDDFKLGDGDDFKLGDGSAISNLINNIAKCLNDDDHDVIPSQSKTNIKQVNEDVNFYDQRATILQGKKEAKVEVSLVDAKISGQSKYAQGSLQVKAVTGEAHGALSAGLYVYEKGPDGQTKKILRPGVSAEVGASVSVLDVSADGRVGLGKDNKMLGAYGKGGVKVKSAEASAKVALNGGEIYAGASAEANLVKAEATGGVSVLGTDIGVTGAVKVGVGAHANVGYTSGKLKVDVGAAVGLGADVGFEVDVSGTVNAVQGLAKSAWNEVSEWIS